MAKEARIALGLKTRPDAVIDPVDLVVQRPGRTAQQLPAGTAIRDIYDQLGGALLILGAPGAGKTTLLLELTRDLLDRATDDPHHPIPVVFPISTWAIKRRPRTEWLVDELVLRYQVPRKLAQAWIDADAILPLLHGLDEVAAPIVILSIAYLKQGGGGCDERTFPYFIGADRGYRIAWNIMLSSGASSSITRCIYGRKSRGS